MQSALTFSPSHLIRPHPLFFNSPFLSHFPIFSPFQNGWSYCPGERCQMISLSILDFVPQTLIWAFIVAACLSHILFFLWRSDAVFLPFRTKKNSSRHRGTWQHDSGFKRLTRFLSRRISKLCKTQRDVNGIACRTGVTVFTLSDLTRQVGTVVASHADILSARHALLLNELVRQ